MLELAMKHDAKYLLPSTSECYGDPDVHPQVETYWGNVNPVGPRSCYDESKRYAEALTMAYHRTSGVRTNIARIFNTYGPRMALNDGRVVAWFRVTVPLLPAFEKTATAADRTNIKSATWIRSFVICISFKRVGTRKAWMVTPLVAPG